MAPFDWTTYQDTSIEPVFGNASFTSLLRHIEKLADSVYPTTVEARTQDSGGDAGVDWVELQLWYRTFYVLRAANADFVPDNSSHAYFRSVRTAVSRALRRKRHLQKMFSGFIRLLEKHPDDRSSMIESLLKLCIRKRYLKEAQSSSPYDVPKLLRTYRMRGGQPPVWAPGPPLLMAYWKMVDVDDNGVLDASGFKMTLQGKVSSQRVVDRLFGHCISLNAETPESFQGLTTYNYYLWPEMVSAEHSFREVLKLGLHQGFTFEMWVQGSGELIGWDRTVLSVAEDGEVKLGQGTAPSKLVLRPSTWNHLALVRDPAKSSLHLFVNGRPEERRDCYKRWSVIPSDWDWKESKPWSEGRCHLGRSWTGRLGPVRIYPHHALSAEEIHQDLVDDLGGDHESPLRVLDYLVEGEAGATRKKLDRFLVWLGSEPWDLDAARAMLGDSGVVAGAFPLLFERLDPSGRAGVVSSARAKTTGILVYWKMARLETIHERKVIRDESGQGRHISFEDGAAAAAPVEEPISGRMCLPLQGGPGLATYLYHLWPEMVSPARRGKKSSEMDSFTLEAWVEGSGTLLSLGSKESGGWLDLMVKGAGAGPGSEGQVLLSGPGPDMDGVPMHHHNLPPENGLQHLALRYDGSRASVLINGEPPEPHFEPTSIDLDLTTDWNWEAGVKGSPLFHLAPSWEGRLGPVLIWSQARPSEDIDKDIDFDPPEEA